MKGIGKFSVLIVLIALALLIKVFSGLYVDYIWFKDLGYTQLFITPIVAKLAIGVISFLIYFLIIGIMGLIAFKTFINAEQESPIFRRFPLHVFRHGDDGSEEKKVITPLNKKKVRFVIILASLLISLMLSLQAVESGWMKLLEFINTTGFGLQDSVFHKDISFYVFQLPFYNFVLNSLVSSLSLFLVFSLFFFPLTGMIKVWGNFFKKG
ncbi:MAG: UPF0182 family protein, partial [Desulfitobacteriaceae bacterium]|nr:UPF0182 family protein [Desulfitobacteriaceae bacterium]